MMTSDLYCLLNKPKSASIYSFQVLEDWEEEEEKELVEEEEEEKEDKEEEEGDDVEEK